MAYQSGKRPTFFEVFKARCSDSDLGPISLDWFEELSSEAPPYEPKLLREPEGPIVWFDQTFKTPKAKSCTDSQLASTPLIFKEQNTMPPFSSPGRDLDQKKMETSREDLLSPGMAGRKTDEENQILASPHGICLNDTTASLTILRNTCRTPRKSNIPGPYGSLFCTPKFLEIRTPKRISESLGAEVDPEMSWSSSLATPPTLGATVLIARENDSISGAKQQNEKAEIVLRNIFPKDDEYTAKNDTSLLSIPERVKLNDKDDIKDLESEMLDGFFGETNSFEDSFNLPAESSGTLLLLPHALDAIEKCEIKTDETQGKGDVLSEQLMRRKTAISQEVEAANWTAKSCCIEVKNSVFQNTDEEDIVDSKDSCLVGHEKELEYLRIAGNLQDNRTQKSSVNEKLVKDVLSSSSQWSQLNLSDLDVTHLEMSICSSPQSDLCREKGIEEKSALMTEDDAVEMSLLNTSGLINAQELSSANLTENCSDMKISANIRTTSEITPLKPVCASPKLVTGCATEEVSKMSFLNCSSFLVESTNVMEYSVVYNSTFSTRLKATSKSVVTDVLSHPLICSAASPDSCSDLHLTNSENALRKSSFKSLNMLSRLRKKSKRFIYTINNTVVYREENVQKEVTSEARANPVLTHLESDSCEFKSCQVATDANQDCLVSAEKQSNIKENNFKTSTVEVDIMDNSSEDSVNSGLKQQELSDSGKNARECQPATSFKCLEASRTRSEDTTDCLNSGRISNIKQKVLTSACLMARRHSRLFPEDCCLRKGKNDAYISPSVNSRAVIPRSPKGQPPQSSPSSSDCLSDMHHGTAFVTNSKFSNTLSQVKFGMNRVSSNSCNKISADKRHATGQLSAAECREIVAPLGTKCLKNNSIGLKQWGKKDVDENQETPSVKNGENPQADAWNKIPVEIAEEFLDCMGNNSLIEVVSEEDSQVAPGYFNTKPVENLEHKGKSSGDLIACSSSLSFGGFQTASNKQIKFSESSIAKGKMLFKDIENECFEASSIERVRNFSNQVQKENVFSSDLETKTGSALSGSQARGTLFIPCKVDLCKNLPRNQLSVQEPNQSLTASQEAEIAELSNILEETGSQFEFTQFRKQSNTHSHVQQFGARNVQNASEAGEDADFCSSLKSENHVINDEYCGKLKNENECKMVEYEKEDTVVFHKNNKKVTFTNLNRNGSGMSNHESCPVPLQASFSNFVGFTSAGGKKINISKAALTRSAELFRDLDDNFLFKSSETNSGCCNSDGHVSSNWNFLRCQTKEEDGGILCVPNIRSTGPVSHHSEKNYAENVSTPCKENTENWTEILSDNANVDVSCTDARCSASGMRNSPSSCKNPHQNCRNSDQFLNQEDSQVEGCLQEDSSYLICLGDNITSEEEHGLSVSGEVEHLSPNQKDRKQEDEHLLQNCQVADTGAVSISHSSLCSSLHDLSVQCGERDADVSENSSKQTTNSVSVEGEDSSKKNLFVNAGGTGSYQHHQIPSEQETVGEKNEVKGTYLTGFHTASGKKITIADGFLAKAEKFFSENNIDLGKYDSEYFEDCLRKYNKNYAKDCDLCMDSVAQCDVDVHNFKDKLIPEEPGDCLKKTVEGSPIKQAVNHDSIKVGAFVNVDEDCKRNLAALCTNKKAHVRPGNSEVESLPGCGSNSLSRTPLLEDRQLFAERDVECSVKKRDNSERKPDFPLQSATSLHLTEVSSDLADNSMPAGIIETVSAEDSCKSHQSLLLTHSSVPESNSPYLNCGSKEIDLKCLNEPYSNADCFPNTADNAHQEQSEVGLPEGGTNLTCLQKTSPNAENQKSVLKQVFSTAKGKAVSVSESALASIRQMFQTDCDESVKSEIETKSGTNQTENSGNSSFSICAGSPGFATFLDTTKSEMNLAASHFINGNGNLSEKGCQDANTFADADSVLDSQMQCFEQKSKLLGHLPVPDKQMEQSGPSGNLGFFSTASGKPVQLSEESLKKARQLFSEMEGSHSSGLQDALLLEEGVEKSRNRDEIFPREMQLALLRETENAGTDVISSPALGFSTASGKKVTISESAYRKAKAILKESDSFLGNELSVTDELSEMQESGQHAKHLTGKVISESKTEKSCTEDLDLKSIYPEEMKSFPSTHHVEITEYVPHSKRNSQSAPFKNSFDQVETRFFRKGELNLGMKTESLSDLSSATSKAEINFQTPKGYLKTEAAESAKAFMEDDLSDSGVQVKSAQSFIGKMSYNFENKPFGKRHLEEKDSLGEPPIKRQLLLEFEKMKIPPKSLKPLKSTPDGIFKDRRKFMYHVPLKPVTCQPLGTTKERQEVRNPTLTLPDQDLKGFKSIPAVFQHCALRQSASGASGLFTPHKAAAKESEETRSLCMSGKAVKTFVPPFKTKLTLSTGEQGSSRCHSPIRNNVTKERGLNQIPVEQNSAETQGHQSCTLHAAVTNLESDNLVMSNMIANLHCARDLQEMRIKKKYRQNISPQPGSLYVIKTSARNRMSLKTAVEEETPSFHSTEKLYTYGVSKHCIQVNSTNAESFQFLIEEFFSKEYLLAGNGIQLADGGWLIPTDEGKAGKKEFYRALCDTPGVDPKLITEAWVYNHYRWIVWKLAAMEVSFPHKFANRCLTPERVLLQLKYRYDLEIDKSKRSAIKKITERDDAAGKTLVLCVSKIQTPDAAVSPSNSNNNMESEKAAAIIEVTDGWYGIRALLDPPLKAFLHRRRLTVGQKIIVHGAELIGSPNGCTPLEAPDSLMLKISANSTRCARWYAKLGFHRDPKPFPLPLSSLYSEGGAVGCIDVVIQRTYPIQWMEKTPAGSYVFRNSRAEEREAAKHAEHQQKKLESLFAKIQAEFEKHEERSCRRTPRSRIVTRQQIHNLQDGAELYEAIQNAPDPSYMEGYLSEDQLKALNAHKQLMYDKKQTLIQEEFKKAVESAEQEKHGCSKRDVSTVWRLFVVDYRKQEKRRGVILSIWRPLLDVCSLLKEGSRYRIYQLSASQSKGRSDSTNVQLSATKKTQYLQLSVSQKILLQIFSPRKALKFTSLLDPSYQPPCAEVDVVGVVISISRTGFTNIVYLSDESCNLVAIKIRADLRHFAIEDIVVRCSFIAASNLQWQSEFRSEIPVLLAGDLSAFSASPKENHLQERFNELRRMIENVDSFCSDAESKLMNLLQRNCSVTPILPKRCGLECFSPSCNSGLCAEDKSSISSKTEMKHQSPLSASTPNTKLFPQGSAVTPSSAVSNENHPRNSKKRKAMDFLSCIPAPPPLTPICSIISPSLKKAFQPPRSLGSRHSKSAKDTNPNTGCVTPSRKLREAVQLPDNDLVADEELAMINTQALINTVPEEKKMDYVNEDSARATDLSGDTRATHLSGDLSSRNSSRSAKEANGSLKSSSEGADALQKDTEESEGSLSIRRVLQKRKSRKCN